jgi:coenzyme F420 hydrogenase subunit beta
MQQTITIKSIVKSGLCIGCGLCETLSKRVTMQPATDGSLRPFPLDGFTGEEETLCAQVCPGIHVRPRNTPSANDIKTDDTWGRYQTMQYAWAANENTRFIGSTGGVLTALGQYLINSGQVNFIYHVKANSDQPLQSHACISETAEQVLAGAGSRYAPVAPLSALNMALERNQPFAVIAR